MCSYWQYNDVIISGIYDYTNPIMDIDIFATF